MNENKANNNIFSLRHNSSPPVFLNEKIIPKVDAVKYLDVYLDKRLILGLHIKIKRKSLNLILYKFRHLLRSNISLSLTNYLYTNKLFAQL
jgi:hypothetical protein